MKTVTIDRQKWLRGKYCGGFHEGFENVQTKLWSNVKEAGCCLGHCLHQAHRMPYKDMMDIGMPDTLAYSMQRKNPLAYKIDGWVNTDFARGAAAINDSILLTEKQREAQLILLFKANGYKLNFIN